MKQCAWCHVTFEPSASSQIYCSAECRIAATKRNQAQKARERRLNKRKQKHRVCGNKGCNNPLSVYNDSKYCFSCAFSEHAVIDELKEIKRRINA